MARTIWRDSAAIHACKDPAERSRLAWGSVLRNPGLVRHIARKVYGFVDDDTVSACQISLHDALLYTDPSKGSPFRVGVWFALRGLDGRHGVHIPRHLITAYRSWVGSGGDTRNLELPTQLSDEERVRIVWLLSRSVSSLNLSGTEWHFLEEMSYEPSVEMALDLVQIHELLDGMSERSRDTLLCVFEDEGTLSEVGRRHGVSRERIRQLHAQLFQSLQDLFKERNHGP